MEAKQRPVPRRPLIDIIEDLQKPIPARLLKSKTIQGKQLTYCPWYRVNKILDWYTGGAWNYEVISKNPVNGHLLVTVRITIDAAEGQYFREGTGLERLDTDSYGDASSNAESMAIRRAARRILLAKRIRLYWKELPRSGRENPFEGSQGTRTFRRKD